MKYFLTVCLLSCLFVFEIKVKSFWKPALLAVARRTTAGYLSARNSVASSAVFPRNWASLRPQPRENLGGRGLRFFGLVWMQPLFLGYRGFSAPIRLYSCINWPFYALCHLPKHLFWGGSPRNDENQSRIRLISSGGAATGARSYLCAPRRRPKPTKKSLKCHKNWQPGNLASFGLFYLGLVWLVFGLVWTFTVGLFFGWFWELSPRFSRRGPGNPGTESIFSYYRSALLNIQSSFVAASSGC